METLDHEGFEELPDDQKSVIFFYTPRSRASRLVTPVVETIEGRFNDVDFYQINVDEDDSLLEALDIATVPTLLALYGQDEVGRMYGYNSREKFANFLNVKYKDAGVA